MLWPIGIGIVVVLALGLGSSARRPPLARRPLDPGLQPDPAPDDESPSALAMRDPLEALQRFGTPSDAARLAGEGVDLAALGHRPPD